MKLRQLTVAAAIGVLTACSGGAGDPPTAPPASTDIASVIIRLVLSTGSVPLRGIGGCAQRRARR
jgi:hypothetical protein